MGVQVSMLRLGIVQYPYKYCHPERSESKNLFCGMKAQLPS